MYNALVGVMCMHAYVFNYYFLNSCIIIIPWCAFDSLIARARERVNEGLAVAKPSLTKD